MTRKDSADRMLATRADLDPVERVAVRRALTLGVVAMCLLIGGVSLLGTRVRDAAPTLLAARWTAPWTSSQPATQIVIPVRRL
jgi:hypothetical protein